MKVLFIDDDGDIARLYKRALDGPECWVKLCPSVKEALDVARSGEAFQVVVLDVMMPWAPYTENETGSGLKTGLRLYRDLVQHCPHAKYVVLTAYSNNQVPPELLSDPRIKICSKGDYRPREFARLVLDMGHGR